MLRWSSPAASVEVLPPRRVAAAHSLGRHHQRHDRHLVSARSGTLVSCGRPSPRSPSSLSGGIAAPYLCRPKTALLPARPSSFSSSDLFTTFVPTPLPSRLRTPPPCCSALQAVTMVTLSCVTKCSPQVLCLLAYVCAETYWFKLFLLFLAIVFLVADTWNTIRIFKEMEEARRNADKDMVIFIHGLLENIKKNAEMK